MKHYMIWMAALISACCLWSCKDTSDTIGDSIINENGQDRDGEQITGDGYVYHIPIIFHVFYNNRNDTTQYIEASRLKEILTHVNELYQGNVYLNPLDSTPSQDIHIQFELAQKDESGKPMVTPGVEYLSYPDAKDSIDCESFMNDKSGKYKQYIWDPNDYINVMVYNFKLVKKDETILGISHMPYKVGDKPAIEGLSKSRYYPMTKKNLSFPYCVSLNAIYVNKKYEGTRYTQKDSTNYTYSSLDPNATLAHELGHYLGLKHAFTELADKESQPVDSCKDTDYCDDTPSYNRSEYARWLKQQMTKKDSTNNKVILMKDVAIRWNDKGQKWIADNIMDYSICFSSRFTTQQQQRMRQVLYYSPLIPGPKVSRTSTRSLSTTDEIVDLPITVAIRKIKNNNIYIKKYQTK